MFCLDVFVFFKQKTADEMRISDGSSDVCSSDLTDEYLEYLAQTFFARLLGSKTAAQTDDEDCSKLLLGSELEQAMAQDAQIPSEPLHSSGRSSSGPRGVDRKSDVQGKRVSVREELGGGRVIKKKNKNNITRDL